MYTVGEHNTAGMGAGVGWAIFVIRLPYHCEKITVAWVTQDG